MIGLNIFVRVTIAGYLFKLALRLPLLFGNERAVWRSDKEVYPTKGLEKR